LLLGDVIVCPAVAQRQFSSHAGTLDDEIALLLVHGVLHVMGHDHMEQDQRETMQRREREILVASHWMGDAPPNFRQDHPEDTD
jgi:probable rRNA maturation factor